MTDLIIDRLHAQAAVTAPDDEARIRCLLADLTTRRLDEMLIELPVQAGDWCVRHLDVSLDLAHARQDVAIAREWARTVTAALRTALAGASPDVVHFPRRLDAVVDLVAALAVGRPERQWAWRAIGVLTDTDPDPVQRPAETVISVLAREPGRAVHALSSAVTQSGLPAVHRMFGAQGWHEVAAVALAALGHRATDWLGDKGPAVEDTASPHDARPLARNIAARSPFALAWRQSRLRPDPGVRHTWALLAAAEAEPALLRRPEAAAVLALLPSLVEGVSGVGIAAPAVTPHRDGPGRHGDGGDVRDAASPGLGIDLFHRNEPGRTRVPDIERGDGPGIVTAAADSPATLAHLSRAAADAWPRPGQEHASGVAVPDGEADSPVRAPVVPGQNTKPSEGARTRRGGLVYLFASAATAGIPEAAFADDVLRDRPVSWLLYHLALILADDHDARRDPAVRAVAGLPPNAVAPGPEPTAAQCVRLVTLADAWASATAKAMGDGEDPRALVARITARDGVILHEPGWIEFQLRLADVDVDVRRAGLDLDPGFVPWLGAVVVIRYD